MPGKSRKTDPSSHPTFVFKGTVQELKSATMNEVPVSARTIVVSVDQVLEAPKNLAKLGGHKITVQLSGKRKARVGQELIFYTQGWIFGHSVAVQSLNEEPITQSAAHAALLSRGGDPVVHKRSREVSERFDSADMVVSGKITTIRLPAEEITQSKAGTTPSEPVSEHSPHWREAVIDIDEVHKGKHTKKSVVIRFPASTDVRWYKAPKFEAGHQGYFMLHKTPIAKGAAPRGAKGKAAEPAADDEVYTALHPLDFQPYSQQGGVRQIIEAKKA
jgi:hypothetical protein